LRAAIVGYEVATLNPALGDAMMFAVKDLDGKPKGWEALVDLKLFYPKPFKQVLLQPDAKA
jgi:hypothetical protein